MYTLYISVFTPNKNQLIVSNINSEVLILFYENMERVPQKGGSTTNFIYLMFNHTEANAMNELSKIKWMLLLLYLLSKTNIRSIKS